jgi:hypothetical protein
MQLTSPTFERDRIVRTPCEDLGCSRGHGVFRLRGPFASRTTRSAQDDRMEKERPKPTLFLSVWMRRYLAFSFPDGDGLAGRYV